jgi:hypothetical protein
MIRMSCERGGGYRMETVVIGGIVVRMCVEMIEVIQRCGILGYAGDEGRREIGRYW